MQLISGLLERYRNFTTPQLVVARAVRAAIKDAIGVDIGEKDMKIQNGRAIIRIGGLQKAEILMRREEILSAVRSKTRNAISDIQ